MQHQSLAAQTLLEKDLRKTRREPILNQMRQIAMWSALETLVHPHCSKADTGAISGVSIILRTYFVQQWFKPSDLGLEEALYKSASSALRR